MLESRIPQLFRRAPEAQLTPIQETSRLAASYFARASREFPSSVQTQAAKIASLCKESGADPQILGEKLLSNPEEINKITQAANAAHAMHDIKEISEQRVPVIIQADFNAAEVLMVLDKPELDYILYTLYPTYFRSGLDVDVLTKEFQLQKQVGYLISTKELALYDDQQGSSTIGGDIWG